MNGDDIFYSQPQVRPFESFAEVHGIFSAQASIAAIWLWQCRKPDELL